MKTRPVDEVFARRIAGTDKNNSFQPENTDFDLDRLELESTLGSDDGDDGADLTEFSPAALEGYLATFERDYIFEHDPRTRKELKLEIVRVQEEIARRKGRVTFLAEKKFCPPR